MIYVNTYVFIYYISICSRFVRTTAAFFRSPTERTLSNKNCYKQWFVKISELPSGGKNHIEAAIIQMVISDAQTVRFLSNGMA
jgi:hypothetical protein